ncbi:hypothetical protein [Rhizobium mayense]|uniref:hypothetical protein n=1 Tax=Rhizobium mayense TaxID=1312184 RepID=UPI00398C4C66
MKKAAGWWDRRRACGGGGNWWPAANMRRQRRACAQGKALVGYGGCAPRRVRKSMNMIERSTTDVSPVWRRGQRNNGINLDTHDGAMAVDNNGTLSMVVDKIV